MFRMCLTSSTRGSPAAEPTDCGDAMNHTPARSASASAGRFLFCVCCVQSVLVGRGIVA